MQVYYHCLLLIIVLEMRLTVTKTFLFISHFTQMLISKCLVAVGFYDYVGSFWIEC